MAERYDHAAIDAKWQSRWEKDRAAFVDTAEPGDKFYMLNMFPYPSGSRLHVGHGRNYILGDALYRFERMTGRRVLNPMGWDAFGLPAENAAIASGTPPREYTLANIARMKEQLRSLGLLYDWSKELASCDPDYYRWNQWLFLRMWERGLAYRKQAPVNWCPGCRTVLANEQVVDGRCERSGDAGRAARSDAVVPAHHRTTPTACSRVSTSCRTGPTASRRCSATGSGDRAAPRSSFAVEGFDTPVTVFTTRPDTLFGATFLALAPEHPAAQEIALRPARSSDDRPIYRARPPGVPPRTGVGDGREGRARHGRAGPPPGDRRAHPDLARQFRPARVRHGRHHGRARARPARFRVRAQVPVVRSCRYTAGPTATSIRTP